MDHNTDKNVPIDSSGELASTDFRPLGLPSDGMSMVISMHPRYTVQQANQGWLATVCKGASGMSTVGSPQPLTNLHLCLRPPHTRSGFVCRGVRCQLGGPEKEPVRMRHATTNIRKRNRKKGLAVLPSVTWVLPAVYNSHPPSTFL